MCGLCGMTWREPGRLSGRQGRAVMDLVAHRGPDDRGVLYVGDGRAVLHEEAVDAAPIEVALLHQRLSILDLSRAARQPMGTPDGRYYLVFNGEIYNYLELRDRLQAEGYGPFHSHGDTEVLLAGYACWGAEVLHRLVGMFAFAVLDTVERRLFLARDGFGIKPLYYAFWQEGFAFSSEITPLLHLPGVSRQANPQRVYDYLAHGITDHGRETLFEDVHQLEAGHYLEVNLARPEAPGLRPYGQLDPAQRLELSFDEAARHLRTLFLDSIRLHMRSDVPVGAALSGGIDSSAIVAGMRHVCPEVELHAISYVAEDAALSEERWADLAAAHARAAVHKVRPAPQDLADDLDALIRVQEEPFASTSVYAQYRVFRQAQRAGLKVMLDGQGADELLGGYRLFLAARLAGLLRRGEGGQALRFLQRLRHHPAAGGWAAQALYAAGMLLPLSVQAPLMRLRRRRAGGGWMEEDWFAARGVRQLPHLWHAETPHVLQEMLLRSIRQISLPMLLRYEDRNSMAHSIESRVPFLTPPLVHFVLSLPEAYLIDARGTTKAVFRQAMRGIVPDAVLDRKDKIGFVTPQQDWLRRLGPWVKQVLHSEATHGIPFLRRSAVRQDWGRVLVADASVDFKVLWRWLNLIRWVEQQRVNFDR